MDHCWGCGCKGANFKRCPECVRLKLSNCLFCSDDCFRKSWKKHKTYHADQVVFAKNAIPNPKQKAIEKQLSRMVGRNKEEQQLLEGWRANSTGNYRRAEKKATKVRDPFMKHLLLASTLQSCFKLEESAQQYALAAQYANNKKQYLHAILSAFNGFKMVDGEKPEWWTDPELLSLSKQAIEMHASHPLAWDMRAYVLCGDGNWTMHRTRTADDFLEASYCFHREAGMNAVHRQKLLENALAANREAQERYRANSKVPGLPTQC